MKPSSVSRWFIGGGYLFIAFGTAVQLWLERHSPSQYLVIKAALLLSYLLIGAAWWVCISAILEVVGSKNTIARGLVLFGTASAVLLVGNLWPLLHGIGGWNVVTLGAAALGCLAVTVGFWAATRNTGVESLEPSVRAVVRS
jgi:hypothetical protein